MIEKIFDTHAHYDDEAFDEDRYELIDQMLNSSVLGFINCGTDVKTSEFSIKLAEKYDNVYCACGIHPEDLEDVSKSDLDKIKELLKHPKCVAIGEIGLDYHYDFTPREKQIEYLRAQLEIANGLDMPIIFHDRDSHQDTLDLLKEYKPKGVVHCFSGSVEMAQEVLKLGMYIGLGGAVTFKNAKKPVSVAKMVPADRLLLETDSPYMTPVPFRGKRCNSMHIEYSAQMIADVRETSIDEILKQNLINVNNLFGIDTNI